MPDSENDQGGPDQPPPPPAEQPDPAWQRMGVETGGHGGRQSQPPAPRRNMAIIAAVTAVVILLGGSAGTVALLNHRADVAAQNRQEAADREAAAKAAAERQAAKEKAAEKAREAAATAAREKTYDTCVDQLDPLVSAMSTVDARLDVGLSQSEFSDLVGSASIAYSRIDVKKLKGNCLSAGAKLESGFNAYRRVATAWNDCIYDTYCDMDSIDPMMQDNWSAASQAIDRAKTLIHTLDPAN
jgi:hypothetical protein